MCSTLTMQDETACRIEPAERRASDGHDSLPPFACLSREGGGALFGGTRESRVPAAEHDVAWAWSDGSLAPCLACQ